MYNSKLENLESLSQTEFQELLNEYNSLKMNQLSDDEQIRIKNKLKQEAFRRMNLFSLEKAEESSIQTDFVSDMASYTSGVSVIEKKMDLKKKARYITAPQKICDISKKLLDIIKSNVKIFNKKAPEIITVVEKPKEMYADGDVESMTEIDNALDSFMLGFDELSSEQKFVAQDEVYEERKKVNSNFEKVVKNEKIISKLQPGVVRMLYISPTAINILSNRQVMGKQTIIGM